MDSHFVLTNNHKVDKPVKLHEPPVGPWFLIRTHAIRCEPLVGKQPTRMLKAFLN